MLPYRMAVGALRLAAPLLSLGESKLARGMAGRRHAHDLLATWGRSLRHPDRPVVWFHAPSVGEGLQAKAVIDAVLARRPDVQVVFTFFSPSAEDLARTMGAEVAAYLPWDLRAPLSDVLDAVKPDVIAFTKTEVWPVLVAEARRRTIPVGIVGATVPEGAGRMKWPARALMRSTWAALDFACVNSASDGARFRELGVSGDRVHVLGDPGIDSAATRFDARDADAPWLVPFLDDPRPTVVAGSTWPTDERILLPALRAARVDVPGLRVIIAPHEPRPDYVEPLLQALGADGWNTRTLAQVEASGSARDVDAVVVDRVGVLAHLYGLASVSFVGGGFHDAGLHSVLEPAVAETPVVFGPRHQNARAAADLVAEGGAKIAGDPVELAGVLKEWLRDTVTRDRTGRSAASYIEEHRGAAARCADLLVPLLKTNA